MPLTLRLPLLYGVLLLAGSPLVAAESPLQDPVPPAVIGRPVEQIKPPRSAREKPAVARPERNKQAAAPAPGKKAARTPAVAPRPLAAVPDQDAAAPQRVAKQAVDDRVDPNAPVVDDVGKGRHFARKPLAAGAYIGEKHRTAVRRYYAEHPVSGATAKWKIGEPVPRGAPVAQVPRRLLASLPEVPPGHRYVQIGGEVVLVAAASNMVVDGISRAAR